MGFHAQIFLQPTVRESHAQVAVFVQAKVLEALAGERNEAGSASGGHDQVIFQFAFPEVKHLIASQAKAA